MARPAERGIYISVGSVYIIPKFAQPYETRDACYFTASADMVVA